jgi:phage FluMu protein Com
MPDFITLSCPSCGHRLQITEDIDRFACAACGNEHIVNRSGGIVTLKPVIEGITRSQVHAAGSQMNPVQPPVENLNITAEPEKPAEVVNRPLEVSDLIAEPDSNSPNKSDLPPMSTDNTLKVPSEYLTPISTASTPTHAEPKIHCPKCRSENPPNANRCRSCDTKLLTGEGVGQRFIYLIGGILSAAVLGFLFYQFYVRNPGSAPDIPICNPGALGLGAVFVLIIGFTQAVRKTPAYLKYENRANRHVGLNPWQALSDLNTAIELAPEKEQTSLLKQRANLFEKLGLTEDAARDHLVLATSPNAFKGEGEWVAAFTGADADTYTQSRRSAQITSLLSSGSALAIGYCPRCKYVVELDSDQHCRDHPRTKGREIQYVIPSDVLVGKLTVLQKLESGHSQLSAQLTELLDSGQAKAVGFCPRCKAVKELDSKRRCTIHQRVKGRKVQYVVPNELESAMQLVLRETREEILIGRRKTLVAISLVTVSIIFLRTYFSTQVMEFVEKLTSWFS